MIKSKPTKTKQTTMNSTVTKKTLIEIKQE